MDIDPVEHLRYHKWATRLLLDAAAGLTPEQLHKELGTSHTSLFGTLVHVYQADKIWFMRLHGESPASLAGVTPEEGLAKLDAIWTETLDAFIQWAESRPSYVWPSMLEYRNVAGHAFSNPVREVLLHVVNHGTLHRGQVMAMFRQVGAKPPATDLLFYYRALQTPA